MARRLKLARAGAAVVGASVAVMTAAIPAGADPVSGHVDDHGYTNGYHVNVGKNYDDMATSLIGFQVDDGSRTELQMYCVEIDTRIDTQHGMVEKSWDSYPNPKSPFHANRSKINWILHYGYPVVGTEALAKTLTDQGVKVTNGISDKEAISATQAAVWHFSDGKNLDEANPLPKGPMDSGADVVALYKYLTGNDNVGIGEQPTPALAISPADATGVTGDKIGPFTVSTTGQVTKLTTKLPAGVKVVDADGKELTSEQVKDGSKLFLDVPADAKEGNGTFELTATAGVDTGRLFVGENYAEQPTQSLIVAKAEKSEIVASAGAKWTEKEVSPTSSEAPPTTTTETSPVPTTPTSTSATPAPQPKNTSGALAETGASIFVPVLIGVVLLAGGVGSLLFLRRRKRA
ncbi:Cys-Gln thioester bond-forming surface protein [Actinophytocola sp.]|uniref:Cys-Gln thioester bond-forming surface protein n=1 Tax=Actinophytocola sp. TaxID=1872138 RepID=UPI00389A1B18